MKRHTYFAVASVGILLLLSTIIFRTKSASTLVAARSANHAPAKMIPMPKPVGVSISHGHSNLERNKPRTLEAYGKLPMAFEANRGQTDGRVKFLSRGSGYTVFLTPDEAVLALQKPSNAGDEASGKRNPKSENRNTPAFAAYSALGNAESKIERAADRESSAPSILRMKLVGARAAAKVTGLKELPGKSNYFIGSDPRQWHTQVPTYAQVRYENAYPGIDLVYYGHQGQLEYDFVVAPGASAKAITLAFDGTSHKAPLRIDDNGDLVVTLDNGEVSFHKPVVYQPAGAERNYVDGRYVLKGEYEVGFEIGMSDATKPLVIDPTLSYSTYLGGSGGDFGFGIAVDSVGNAYVTGYTFSTDFPTSIPSQSNFHGYVDVFVAAIDRTGTKLLYSTYLGGSGDDEGNGIAVDSAGNAYVTGYTFSTDFPTSNPLQPTNHGFDDAFVAAIDPTGTRLLYSTYLGGSDTDVGEGIAVDSAGNAYVTGYTVSTNFPTSYPLQPTFHGYVDAFVAAIDPTGTKLLYSTYLGGSDYDYGYGIAVDSAGIAYVTGVTNSTNFPTSYPLQPTIHGFRDAFVAAIGRNGATLLYSTYLGGSGQEVGLGIAVDSAGNAYVTGNTDSTDFPTSNPLQPTNHGFTDAFVTAITPTGATLLYSTYLGGSNYESGLGIAVDSARNAYVTGHTSSVDFPTSNPLQATNHGFTDAFVAAIAPTGATLLYSTYLGGSVEEYGTGIAVDSAGNAYVTGFTASVDFPASHALQPTNHGGNDAFVARIILNGPPRIVTPASANPNPVTGTTTNLSVLGADDGGEANLVYTWATTGTPPARVTFSPNATNAAKNVVARFTKAGNYSFRVTIKDQGGLTVTSSVSVTVNQTLSNLTVAPTAAMVATGGTQQFTPTALDQFRMPMSPPPPFEWTAFGGGTISSSGLFTAGNTPGGPFPISVTAGGGVAVATVTVTAPSTVAYVQGATMTGDSGAGSIARAFAAANTAGNLIVAAVSWANNAGVTCSDSQGNTYSVATMQTDTLYNQSLAVCYAANVKGGANVVTATFGGAPSYRRLLIHEYQGIAVVNPVDVVAKNVANGTTTPNGITSTSAVTTSSGDLIFGAVMDDFQYTSITAGTGFTQRLFVNNKDLATEDLVQAAAGSIAATQTFGAPDRYLAQMVAFKAGGPANATPIISTVAGNGVQGFGGDGGAATSASLNAPFGAAVDGAGNLFIVDGNNDRIRKVTPGGIISTVAGNGLHGFGGDGGAATSAILSSPRGVAVDGASNLFIADSGNERIREVTSGGIISTVAGNGAFGFGGDGGAATSTSLYSPTGVAVDRAGNFFIADYANNRIRQVTTGGIP